MPYRGTGDLPSNVKNVLPVAAQRLWLRTFNAVYQSTKGSEKEKDTKARMAAWANVKHLYKKGPGGKWVRKKSYEGWDSDGSFEDMIRDMDPDLGKEIGL